MASIKQQPNGKWRYRIRYKDKGKFKEISKSGFRLKSEAVQEAIDIENRIRKGKTITDRNMLVSDYLTMWLNIKKKTVKQSTLLKINRAMKLYILPEFGFSKLSELNRLDCVTWAHKLCDDLQVNSVKSYLAPFNQALEDAVIEYKILDDNPMKNIKYPKQNKKVKDISFYEKDKLKLILEQAQKYKGRNTFKNETYYVLTVLLARTGLRLGEALALTWDDFKGNTLNIDKTLYRENGVDIITTPKTESSYRKISLDTPTCELLKRLKVKKAEYAMATLNKPSNQSIIFTKSNGDYLIQSNYRTYFAKICELAEVDVLSPHSLRHSHAVHLLESGASLKFVSERLGHATINMTADVYLHISEKLERDSMLKFEEYF